MSADPEIQFGDLEEEQPDIELRPDRNAHYAVVPYGEPLKEELPIFVDIDVLIEMESHALTDTSVELGGVMLGGQMHDEDGRPYVLVQDSLRAEHYEATKGSFKFTHDTWQQITKQRDEFPDDWDMVGWYHTHPDWGVFLSGMDMFICDNFFNKPLDIALVIDPCRQDRGLFQWTGDPRERKRRVNGFYVIASRHRQGELENFVAELEGGYTMRTDPNVRAGYNVSSGGGGAPTIVNISEQRPGWLGQAVVWCIAFQTLMLLMFGYMAFIEPDRRSTSADDQQALLDVQERNLAVKRKVLDDVIKNMSDRDKVATRLEEQSLAAAELERELQVAKAGVPKLIEDHEELVGRYEEALAAEKRYSNLYKEAKEDLSNANAQIEVLEEAVEDGKTVTWYSKYLTPTWLGIGALVIAFVGAAGYFAVRGMQGQDAYPEELLGDPPPPEGRIGPAPEAEDNGEVEGQQYEDDGGEEER